jgi:hypothetical protein
MSIDRNLMSIKASRKIEHICAAQSGRPSNEVVPARCIGIPLTLIEGSEASKIASLNPGISSADDF